MTAKIQAYALTKRLVTRTDVCSSAGSLATYPVPGYTLGHKLWQAMGGQLAQP